MLEKLVWVSQFFHFVKFSFPVMCLMAYYAETSVPVTFGHCEVPERHTQRRKAANFNLIYFIFERKIRWKVPHENIHGEASILENFQKKIKSPHFQEGKKKSFEIATFWGEVFDGLLCWNWLFSSQLFHFVKFSFPVMCLMPYYAETGHSRPLIVGLYQ